MVNPPPPPPNIWQMMTCVNSLDALIPKSPFSFSAEFMVRVTSGARGSVLVEFLGGRQLSSLWGRGGGASQYRPPPPWKARPPPGQSISRLPLETRGRRKQAAIVSSGTDIPISPTNCTTKPCKFLVAPSEMPDVATQAHRGPRSQGSDHGSKSQRAGTEKRAGERLLPSRSNSTRKGTHHVVKRPDQAGRRGPARGPTHLHPTRDTTVNPTTTRSYVEVVRGVAQRSGRPATVRGYLTAGLGWPLGRTWPTAKAFAFLCVDSTQRSETGQVRGLRWHNRPREREGKECGEADGHGGLQRERPREGKGEGRGKVRARRKRKVKGW